MGFLLETIRLGLTNLRLHLLRSFLTALGIILGIAAVILMMAIAQGAKVQALRQLEILGARNVILRSVKPPEDTSMTGGNNGQSNWINAYGLTRRDYYRLTELFSKVAAYIVPMKLVGSTISHDTRQLASQTYGTTPDLPHCANFKIARGRYLTEADLEEMSSVCVIGHLVARQLFPLTDPIGKTIRVDTKSFRVVGVLAPIGLAGGAGSALVGRDLNRDVHIPMTTAEGSFGDLIMRRSSGSRENTAIELSEVYVSFSEVSDVIPGSRMAERVIELSQTRDRARNDVEVVVPFELIENARRMAQTWSNVMLAIAAIALVVGGTGIMNIMLASVTERTREIGIRRALGATRLHIISQFLVETGVLSLMGGIIGIAVGTGCAFALGEFDTTARLFPTMITGWSIIVSFAVACGVGIIFGMYPANLAAQMDPIVALRHD